MLDVTGPLLIVVLIGIFTYLPIKSYFVAPSDRSPQEVRAAEPTQIAKVSKIPEDSILKRHCLTNFRAEIEAALGPRPTDSILMRHHDALITAALEKRLAELTT